MCICIIYTYITNSHRLNIYVYTYTYHSPPPELFRHWEALQKKTALGFSDGSEGRLRKDVKQSLVKTRNFFFAKTKSHKVGWIVLIVVIVPSVVIVLIVVIVVIVIVICLSFLFLGCPLFGGLMLVDIIPWWLYYGHVMCICIHIYIYLDTVFSFMWACV